MSLSINKPAFVQVDTTPMDRHSPAASKAGTESAAPAANSKPLPPPVRQDNAKVLHNEMMINAGALTKLFDMLEQVFKSMREMFSVNNPVNNLKPGALPSSDKTLADAPGTSKLPVKPDMRDQPVKPDAAKPPVKPHEHDQAVKPDAGKLPANPLTTVMPDARKVVAPGITVTNDAKADVHVNVNVGHCHCPDTNVLPDSGRKLRVDVQPDVKPDVKPGVEPGVKPDVKPGVEPGVKPDVKPGVEPGVKPGVEPGVKPDVKPGVEPGVKPGVEPGV
ncbi:hypothetical protein ACI77M_29250, partial [Pseudomonas fildesensis]|uniref:hypothetical protein n=1 Tax=Pseudomonas fildesensis TaxID=1674920 RepID=UPI00387B466D